MGPVEAPETPVFPGTPRWVKIGAIVALIVILLLAIVLAFGPGDHGPGRHDANQASRARQVAFGTDTAPIAAGHDESTKAPIPFEEAGTSA